MIQSRQISKKTVAFSWVIQFIYGNTFSEIGEIRSLFFSLAACLSLAMILLLVAIQDAVAWHVIPLIIIAILAELVRGIKKYNWTGDVAGTAIMSFSSFGYYGQIWFNRTFTYDSAVAEMPAGYADNIK